MRVVIACLLACLLMTSCNSGIFGRAVKDIDRTSNKQVVCILQEPLKVSEISGIPQICIDPEQKMIRFSLEKEFASDIEKLHITIHGQKNNFTEIIEYAHGDIKILLKGEISYDTEKYGNLRRISFIPEISQDNQSVICRGKELLVVDIDKC